VPRLPLLGYRGLRSSLSCDTSRQKGEAQWPMADGQWMIDLVTQVRQQGRAMGWQFVMQFLDWCVHNPPLGWLVLVGMAYSVIHRFRRNPLRAVARLMS
jgi:hypothetical protein